MRDGKWWVGGNVYNRKARQSIMLGKLSAHMRKTGLQKLVLISNSNTCLKTNERYNINQAFKQRLNRFKITKRYLRKYSKKEGE